MKGCPPHPPTSQSRPQVALPGSHGRGVWTQWPPQKGVSEMDSKGEGIRQADGQGPTTFLWKGSLANSGDRPGWHGIGKESMCRVGGGWEKAPSAPAHLPRSCRDAQSSGRCTRRRHVAGAGARTVTVPALEPALRAALGPAPFHATKEGEA